MLNLLSILAVILILSLLVLVHEWGHFMAAIKNGIKVDEFGIGFPPNLFKIKGKKTTYSINAIPLGGFVKLHGEDGVKKKFLKDKHSFASKTPWQKVQVVCAGVLMNFLVFWILMTVAITVGVNPLIVSEDDYVAAFENGTFVSQPFLMVESIAEGSKAESLGIHVNDVLKSVDDKSVLGDADPLASLLSIQKDEVLNLAFERGADYKYVIHLKEVESLEEFGLKFYPSAMLPVLKVVGTNEKSLLSENLQVGDKVYAIDGVPVFDFNSYVKPFFEKRVVTSESSSEKVNHVISMVRGSELLSFEVQSEARQIVAGFVDESSAKEAGLEIGDKILRVEGKELAVNDSLLDLVSSFDKDVLKYEIQRESKILEFNIEPNEQGMIGVSLSPEYKYLDFAFDFQPEFVLSSLTEIKKLKKPFYKAPWVALQQGAEMSVLTAKAFGSALFGVVTKLEVSDQVGGPVQVVKLGTEFVSEGGVALLTFIAMISLSLAVINILPIPALDGGRLFFIIIEAFRGKPVSPKFEALLHVIGFYLLILFILVVTFYDIVRF